MIPSIRKILNLIKPAPSAAERQAAAAASLAKAKKHAEELKQLIVQVERKHELKARVARKAFLSIAEEILREPDEFSIIIRAFPPLDDVESPTGTEGGPIRTGKDRYQLCRVLLKLRAECGWEKHLVVEQDIHRMSRVVEKTDDPSAPMFVSAEMTICGFLIKGFKPDEELVLPILDFLLTSPARVGLPFDFEVGIFIHIAEMFPDTSAMPVEVSERIQSLAERHLDLGGEKDWTSPRRDGEIPAPAIAAFLHLAGLKRDSFLVQMRRLPTARLGAVCENGPVGRRLDDLREIDEALDQLIPEFLSSNNRPEWIVDEGKYAEIFGAWPEKSAAFGWWTRPNKARHDVDFDDASYARMTVDDAFVGRVRLADAAAKLLTEPKDDKPVSFLHRMIPEVEIFTFGGMDPDGQLLEHLASADSAAPAKNWFKHAEQLAEEIGKDNVATELLRWLNYVEEHSDDQPSFKSLLTSPPGVFSGGTRVRHAVQPDNEGSRWPMRAALRLMRTPHMVKPAPGGERFSLRDQLVHYRVRRGGLSALNRRVLNGSMNLLSRIGHDLPVSTFERVAIFCLQKAGNPAQELRGRMPGNAAIQALARIGSTAAAEAIGRIGTAFPKDKAIQKEIARALEATEKASKR